MLTPSPPKISNLWLVAPSHVPISFGCIFKFKSYFHDNHEDEANAKPFIYYRITAESTKREPIIEAHFWYTLIKYPSD
jgi:hypothetical protein